MAEPQLLRIPEAASYLNISRTTMYRLISDGTVKTVLVGQRKRVPLAEINRLIAEQMEKANDGAPNPS